MIIFTTENELQSFFMVNLAFYVAEIGARYGVKVIFQKEPKQRKLRVNSVHVRKENN